MRTMRFYMTSISCGGDRSVYGHLERWGKAGRYNKIYYLCGFCRIFYPTYFYGWLHIKQNWIGNSLKEKG